MCGLKKFDNKNKTMAPINIPFFGSVANAVVPVTYNYVSTTINHAYVGKRVRIKLLQFIHRPAAAESILMRMDFSSDFYSNAAGVIASINGSGSNQYNGVSYFQNNAGVGLYLSGATSNVVSSFFGTPTFEGMLLSPRLTITFRPATVAPGEETSLVSGVTTNNFGYAQLILDIEVIE
jgi:hypothetical protein